MQWRTEPDVSKESVENPKPWSALMATPDQAPVLFAVPIKGLPISNIQILEVGEWSSKKTPLAMVVDNSRRTWICDAEFSMARFASTSIGAQILPSALLDEDRRFVQDDCSCVVTLNCASNELVQSFFLEGAAMRN